MSRRREPTEFLETFGALKRRLSALGAQAYVDVQLGSTQAKVLRHVGLHDRITQAELARVIAADPTLTGRTVQALVDRGLVRRERSDEDRRVYVLELTAAGHRARAKVEKMRAELAARVVAVLEDRDLADFERITKKVLAAFEAPEDR